MILRRRYQAVMSVLDRDHVGVFVPDSSGAVLIRNAEADRILDNRDGLCLTHRQQLAVCGGTANQELTRAVGRAVGTAHGEDNSAETLLTIPRRGNTEPLLLDVCPGKDSGTELDPGFKGAFVFVVDSSSRRGASTKGTDVLYGLTETEMNVFDLLIQGLSLEEIAEFRNVSLETIRTQVKSLMNKVGVQSRCQLVAAGAARQSTH